MFRIKPIMLGMISVSMLVYGADEENKIKLRDCFEVKNIEMAGKPHRFYAPVIAGRLERKNILLSLFSDDTEDRFVRIRGCVGIVSSPDRAWTDAVAARVEAYIPEHEEDFLLLSDAGMLSQDYVTKAAADEIGNNLQDLGKLQKALQTQLSLMRFRSSIENRAMGIVSPEGLHLYPLDQDTSRLSGIVNVSQEEAKEAETRYLLSRCVNLGLIVPAEAMDLINALSLDDLEGKTPMERFKLLEKHADDLCAGVRSDNQCEVSKREVSKRGDSKCEVSQCGDSRCEESKWSHHVPVLIFNENTYAAYLAQKFGPDKPQ